MTSSRQREAALIPHWQRFSRVVEILFQMELPVSREKQRADCWGTAKHSSIYRCFMYSLVMLYTILQGLDTRTYSIIQNRAKIQWHLPAIEAVPWVSYSQWGLLCWFRWGHSWQNKHSIQPLCPKKNGCALFLPLSKTKYNSGSVDNRKLKNTPIEILPRMRTSSVIRLLISSLILIRICKTLQLPAIHRLLKAAPSHAQLKS